MVRTPARPTGRRRALAAALLGALCLTGLAVAPPADVRNYQQAGLVAYLDDDHFLRLSHVAIWNTRQTEFGKEMPFAHATSYGGMAVGTPAPVAWLRLSHRIDAASGEPEFRAASSRDGRHWTWGGVWTLPAGTRPRIGLISHGGAGAIAEFDYVRIYRP